MALDDKEFKAMQDPDTIETDLNGSSQLEPEERPWEDDTVKSPYVPSPGHSTILYTKGKADRDPAKAFYSGIGDNDDLFVKKPNSEYLELPFKYAARYRGKKKHEVLIYPEIPFQYGIHYKGEMFVDDNESPFKHRVDAYPAKTMEFDVHERKELPVNKEWKVKLDMETMIESKEYGYAITWSGKSMKEDKGDTKDLFTTSGTNPPGKYVGHGSQDVWYKSGDIVYEVANRSFFSGVVANSYMGWADYEAEFDFKPILTTVNNVSSGQDDDGVGIIFKAQDAQNFWLFFWEREERIKGSYRLPKDALNGYNLTTNKTSDGRTLDDAMIRSSSSMTTEQWSNYVNNQGWGLQHRRVYKVTNGVMQEVAVTDLGVGTGWKMEQVNGIKIKVLGRKVQVFVRHNATDGWTKCMDVETDKDTGSFGMLNASQAVEFHGVRVRQWGDINGRVPATGYTKTVTPGTVTIATKGEDYVAADAAAKAGVGRSYDVLSIGHEEDPNTKDNGSVVTNGPSGAIKVSTINPTNAGQINKVSMTETGIAHVTPDNINPETGLIVFNSIDEVFGEEILFWKASNPQYVIVSMIMSVLKPVTVEDDDWDFAGNRLTMWNSHPPVEEKTKSYTRKVYAYEGWARKINLVEDFAGNQWSEYTLDYREETVDPTYDSIKIENKYLMMKTTEWYKGTYPADIKDEGMVYNTESTFVHIPPMPEHYIHPTTGEVMFHGHEDVHFLLMQLTPSTTAEVFMGFKSKMDSENTRITKVPLNAINGRPVVFTDQINDLVEVRIDDDPRYIPWTSGKYIGYGKVNGKRPFFSAEAGKADLINVPAEVVFLPDNLLNIKGPIIDIDDTRVKYSISIDKKTITFSSDYQGPYVWLTDWYSSWKKNYTEYKANNSEVMVIENNIHFNYTGDEFYDPNLIIIEGMEVVSNNPFVSIWIEESKVHAKVKEATPLPWHPLTHNGYYYFNEKEHYLYAKKISHTITVNQIVDNSFTVSPRPQQGSAIIIRDHEGNTLRKVTFFNEAGKLTLQNKENFSGNGHSKYYLSYGLIDVNTMKVHVNGKLDPHYIWNESESSLQFMQKYGFEDTIQVTYHLKHSYHVDMNYDTELDMALITLHEPAQGSLEVIYEGHLESPFYRAEEIVVNPILNHSHKGFMYVTDKPEQFPKTVHLHVSPSTVGNTGNEKVLLTGSVRDKYDNPIPLKEVEIYRNGLLISTQKTNEAGEVYLTDQPDVPVDLYAKYEIKCQGIENMTLLNFFAHKKKSRSFIELKVSRSAMIGGVDDRSTIFITLRDDDWHVLAGKTIDVSYKDTKGITRTSSVITNQQGKVEYVLSSLDQVTGHFAFEASYKMEDGERTKSYVHIKVIGG